MNKEGILKKEYELFNLGYSTKEIAILLDKFEFQVKFDLFKVINNNYHFKIKAD